MGLAGIALIKASGNRTRIPIWLALCLSVHLVLGGLAVWYGDYDAFDMITLVCWGPIAWVAIVRELRKWKDAKDDAKVEAEAPDKQEPVSKPGEDESSLNESSSGSQGRRIRRRRD